MRPRVGAPRWLHKAYAHAMGYFWLPCALCGYESGGHEWGDDATDLNYMAGCGKGVCPNCYERAGRINRGEEPWPEGLRESLVAEQLRLNPPVARSGNPK